MNNKPDNEYTKPKNSLKKAIVESGSLDLVADIGDIALDKNIQDAIIHEIPIFKIAYSLVKIGSTFQDFLFKKKLDRFLLGFKEADTSLKQKIEAALPNLHDRNEMGEQLLMALERFDQITKADALCKLFLARINGIISVHEFQKLTSALVRIDFNDVDILKQFYSGKISGNEHRDVLRSFVFVQLVSVDYSGTPEEGQIFPRSGGSDEKFTKNALGEKFVTALGL